MVIQSKNNDLRKELRNINIQFSNNNILSDCSIVFNESVENIVLIDGENGCGKTTLMRVMAGIYFNEGIEFTSNEDYLKYSRENVYYLPSGNAGVFYRNTVLSNLNYLYYFYTKKKLDISTVVDKFPGINELLDKTVVTMSSGQKKYLELVIALTINKPILILDEPFTFLSPENVKIIVDAMDSYRGKIIIVSHSINSDEIFNDVEKSIKYITVKRGECNVIYDLD